MLKLQTCADPPIFCERAPECTKQLITLQTFSGGNTRTPTTRKRKEGGEEMEQWEGIKRREGRKRDRNG